MHNSRNGENKVTQIEKKIIICNTFGVTIMPILFSENE